MRARRIAGLICAVCLVLVQTAGVALAQTQTGGVYTLNQEQLYTESAFGTRVVANVSKKRAELERENSKLEGQLKQEEQALTDKRPTLGPAEFRTLADAFDAKVEKIRKDQATKSNVLTKWATDEHGRFFKRAFPILLKLAGEVKAAIIIDERTTIISSDQISLTALAIERVNAEIGDGTQPDAPADASPVSP